jgi:hypothetical protein
MAGNKNKDGAEKLQWYSKRFNTATSFSNTAKSSSHPHNLFPYVSVFLNKYFYRMSHITQNPLTTMQSYGLHCVSFPSSLLTAAAASCCGGFDITRDTLYPLLLLPFKFEYHNSQEWHKHCHRFFQSKSYFIHNLPKFGHILPGHLHIISKCNCYDNNKKSTEYLDVFTVAIFEERLQHYFKNLELKKV